MNIAWKHRATQKFLNISGFGNLLAKMERILFWLQVNLCGRLKKSGNTSTVLLLSTAHTEPPRITKPWAVRRPLGICWDRRQIFGLRMYRRPPFMRSVRPCWQLGVWANTTRSHTLMLDRKNHAGITQKRSKFFRVFSQEIPGFFLQLYCIYGIISVGKPT